MNLHWLIALRLCNQATPRLLSHSGPTPKSMRSTTEKKMIRCDIRLGLFKFETDCTKEAWLQLVQRLHCAEFYPVHPLFSVKTENHTVQVLLFLSFFALGRGIGLCTESMAFMVGNKTTLESQSCYTVLGGCHRNEKFMQKPGCVLGRS